MHTRRTGCLRSRNTRRHDALRRLGLCLVLGLGVALALQGCTDSGGSQFRSVPGTQSSTASALEINTSAHFQGHIAFVRNHQLYVLNGKDDTVSALPAGADVQDPAYSPDGSRLAYVQRGASWSDLMVIAAQGGQPVALTHNQGTGQQITCDNGVSESNAVWAANPIWTPDGSALYYLSDAQKLLKTSCGFLDLAVWKIAAQGGKSSLILWPARGIDATGFPGAGGDADLSLRPGSDDQLVYTHYAYDGQADNERLVQIYLATLDQSQELEPDQPQELALTPTISDAGTPQQAMQASWSPDGNFLAYIVHANGAVSLEVMRVSNPARGAPNFHDYANALPILPDGAYSYPVWSPDGKSLLYVEFKNNEYNLYLTQLTVTGTTISLQGNPVQLTQGGIDGDSRPAWTAA